MEPCRHDLAVGLQCHRASLAIVERGEDHAVVAERSVPFAVRQEPRGGELVLRPFLAGTHDHDPAVGLDRQVFGSPQMRRAWRPGDAVAAERGVERAVLQVPDDDGSFLVAGAGGDDPTVGQQRDGVRLVATRTDRGLHQSVGAERGIERAAGQVASDGEPAADPSRDHDLAVGLDRDLVRRGTVGVGGNDLAGVTERGIEVAAGRARRCGDEGEEECQRGR